MILLLIVITVVVSALCFRQRDLFYRLALSPFQVVHSKQYYRLLTHMFVHGSWLHLIINMLVFYSFASEVWELFHSLADSGWVSVPTLHFLTLYLGGGVTAAVLGLPKQKDNPAALSVGASGGVASVIFASIFFDPWTTLYLFALVPIPGILLGVGYVVYSWRMAARNVNDHIDHRAHLYGAIFGFIYPLLMNPKLISFFLSAITDLPWF